MGFMESVELDSLVEELRNTFESGKTRSFAWRKAQLKSLLKLLEEKEEDIFMALHKDLGKHHVEVFRDEIGVLIKSVNYALDNLKSWMAGKKAYIPLAAFPSSAEIVPEPLGVLLLFSSWNFPIGLSLEPLIGAISAGNAVVLKPSEIAPASSEFLAKNIPLYLDNKSVKVVQGCQKVGEQLLQYKWDKIFFTGSSRVGRIVMSAAAKHLTPVALELGGKCPAIIDSLSSSKDRQAAINRVVGGKWGSCYGQVCIGIDYLFVEEKFVSVVIELLKATIKRFYPKREYMTKIVTKQHFQRLSSLLKDPEVAGSIVYGGSLDSDALFIEPTILVNPPLDSEIMTEEIFGPLLPIITLKNIEDCIGFLRGKPKPLAIYAFTHNENFKKRLIAETSSGSIIFNDAIVQYLCDTIPFGGVGASGFGQYHGKFSFELFSHAKPVLRRNFWTEFTFRYPPWDESKLKFMRLLYRFDYFGLLLLMLGLKR
ncbi:Aldehyde dehydrogenase NAD(P)-dependent protein [Dioscorea alata]|uniref:Aldehyde dehydrogenase NAD(P)-dependent protein n=1 Tax=Dioscorea alata TaxID=55571 RepID=A0ACB7WGB9_DIOAL|nr:Aldehyde dehydrogenase NAD(P)-dependent protein [Dioscorea alata]